MQSDYSCWQCSSVQKFGNSQPVGEPLSTAAQYPKGKDFHEGKKRVSLKFYTIDFGTF